MAQQTMTERDMYLGAFEREFQTTMKLLRCYPANKVGLKPSERSQSAGEVAWTLVLSQHVVAPILQGELMPGKFPPAPSTWPEILGAYETAHRDALQTLRGLTDEAMHGTVRMPTGPRQVGDVRRGDALWMMLNDTVHHRGQLSVYTRIAGGKVPSIYGPSGDEPWS